MIDGKSAPGQRDEEIAAEIRDGLAPELVELITLYTGLVERRLADEGWQPAQLAAIAERAVARFTSDVLAGESASAATGKAIREARSAFMADLFDALIAEGRDRATAFLTLVALERENAERVGEPAVVFPQPWLDAAVAAVEAAARRGAGSVEQVALGFTALGEAGRSAGP